MEESLDEIVLEPKKSENAEWSFKKGMSLICMDGDNIIHYKSQSFNGIEKVFFNDDQVSEKRNFKMSSTHNFDVEGTRYSVELIIVKIRDASFMCEFKKNEFVLTTFLGRRETGKNLTKRRIINSLAFLIISSFIMSFIIIFYGLPEIILIPFGVVLVVTLMSQSKKAEMVIEER